MIIVVLFDLIADQTDQLIKLINITAQHKVLQSKRKCDGNDENSLTLSLF